MKLNKRVYVANEDDDKVDHRVQILAFNLS